jgi:hypothetical protein
MRSSKNRGIQLKVMSWVASVAVKRRQNERKRIGTLPRDPGFRMIAMVAVSTPA